mmetsp:Transcript_34528/g.63723  ORF Transcript_34528/g.63723 Transcript_34528/m.63723 type:complete len:400 (-) Transcript_34528:707-1906(-)
MFVKVLHHVALDQLSVEHGLAHDASNEAEVNKMIIWTGYFTCWINLHTHLICCTSLPQSHIWIKHLLSHQLEPLPCQSPCIDTSLPDELEPPNLSQILPRQAHHRLHRVAQQIVSSYIHAHVPLVPLHTQLGTRVLEPLNLVLVALHLRRGNVRVTHQLGAVGALNLGIHDSLLGGDQRHPSLAHAIVIVQVVQFEHVRGTLRVEAGALVHVSALVEARPLELHVRRANGTGPPVLVVTELNLRQLGLGPVRPIDQSHGQVESNLLAVGGIFGTGDQHAHSPGEEGEGLPRFDPLGDDDLEHLRLVPLFVGIGDALGGPSRSVEGGGVFFFGRGRGNDSDRHAGPRHVGTRDCQLLSIDRDGELLSSPDSLGNFDHIRRLLPRCQILIGNFRHVVRIGW